MRSCCNVVAFLVASVSAWASVPPSTGQASPDPNYKLKGGTAVVVTTQPSTWTGQQSGAKWIGPAAVQSTSTHPSGAVDGNFTFTLTFQIPSASALSKANLKMFVLADPDVDIQLNQSFFQNPSPGPNPSSVTSYTMTQASGLVVGTNTLNFNVSDFGVGPVGLNVTFTGTLGDDSSGGGGGGGTTTYNGITIRTGNHYDAVPDPVDGASGQFYSTDTDLNLGGPLAFSFARFYASNLPASGASSLGTNWMSNFDVAAIINGSTAQIRLFGGNVLTFTNSNNAWQLTSPLDSGYQLINAQGSTYQLMTPVNRRIYSFNSAGDLISIQDRNGNTITVTPGANGPTSISDGIGRTLTLTYTGSQLTQVQDQAGRAVLYTYTGSLLTSVADPLNNTTVYSYTTAGSITGLITKKQYPTGAVPTTQTYDSAGHVITQTDGNGDATKIAYDGSGGTTVTDPFGKITKQTNDANGDLTQLTDPNGASANVTYDSAFRKTTVSDKLGNKMTYTYHAPTGYVATATDPQGNTTTYTYTAQTQTGFTFYNLTGISYPNGTSSSMTYDGHGNILTILGTDGSTKSFAYDSNGRTIGVTDANQRVSTIAYNPDGTVASVTDELGNATRYAYDSAKRLVSVTAPNGGITKYTYDANGRRQTVTNKSGGVSTTTYDANGERTNFKQPLGGSFNFTYTPTLKIGSFTDPLGNRTAYTYDAGDRLSSITDAAGDKAAYTYDASNRITAIADNIGTRISYSYDAQGRVLTSTDATSRKTSYGYDPRGRVTSITTPGGNAYTTAYDKIGRAISLTNPLGEVQSLTRDGAGRVIQIDFPGAITTKLQRDPVGRVTAMTSPNGNTWSFAYDVNGNRTKLTDPLGVAISFTYTQNLLSGITLPLGTANVTTDAAGHITKREFSDGTTISSSYDAVGLLATTDGLAIQRNVKGQPSNINGIAITYDAAGRPATLLYAGGKFVTYTYDSAGRVATVADWTTGKTTLAYDAAGRLATLTYPNGVANTYTYDANGRVSKIQMGTSGSITLTRDADGKILTADRNLPLTPVLQPGSQQFSYDQAARVTNVNYDKMGRVTAQNGRNYTWNLASELTAFQDGVDSAAYTYDGLGGTVSSTNSAGARTAVINYAFHYPALSIVRQGNADLRYYVYMPDGKLLYSVEAATGARHFYHFDEMGNTAFLTGDNGGLTDAYAITPYGEIATHTGSTENPFTWQGQFGAIQEGQQLYYLRSRHYDASTARFVSRDPFLNANPASAEPYAYGRGNPLRYVDPFGTDSETVGYALELLDAIRSGKLGEADIYFAIVEIMVIAANLDLSVDELNAMLNPSDPPPPPPPPDPPAPVTPPPAAVLTSNIRGGPALGGALGGPVLGSNGLPALIDASTGMMITSDGASLIGSDSAGLIGSDSAGIISDNSEGIVSSNSTTLIAAGGGN